MNDRPTVQTGNHLISIEGWRPAEHPLDFTVRIARAKLRGKKARVEFKQLMFRFDMERLSGRFTSWPKKWCDEPRAEVERKLSHLVLGKGYDWPEEPLRASILRILR